MTSDKVLFSTLLFGFAHPSFTYAGQVNQHLMTSTMVGSAQNVFVEPSLGLYGLSFHSTCMASAIHSHLFCGYHVNHWNSSTNNSPQKVLNWNGVWVVQISSLRPFIEGEAIYRRQCCFLLDKSLWTFLDLQTNSSMYSPLLAWFHIQ